MPARTGERIPILLLPGMDGTGELLDELAGKLSLGRRVHLVSYPLDQPLGYGALTALAAAQAPGEPFAVLGESFSGPIAIEIAASHPFAAGLILASSFARHPLPSVLARFARLLDLKRVPARIVEAVLLGRTGTPELRARLAEVLAKVPSDVIQMRAAEALRADVRHRLGQAGCPVLCLHGRFDRVTGARCVREILAAQPRCRLRRFDAAHMLLETHAGEAAKVIGEFCDEL